MTTMYKKTQLKALAEYEEVEGLEEVTRSILDKSRWSINHSLVFKDVAEGKFYVTYFSAGSTENPGEEPYDGEGDDVEVTEVSPVETTVVEYVPVHEAYATDAQVVSFDVHGDVGPDGRSYQGVMEVVFDGSDLEVTYTHTDEEEAYGGIEGLIKIAFLNRMARKFTEAAAAAAAKPGSGE